MTIRSYRCRFTYALTGLIILPMLAACGQQEKMEAQRVPAGSTVTTQVVPADTYVTQTDFPKRTDIDAPYTHIQSDEATGHSSIRAPFVKLDSHPDGSATLRVPFVKIHAGSDGYDDDGLQVKVQRHHYDDNR